MEALNESIRPVLAEAPPLTLAQRRWVWLEGVAIWAAGWGVGLVGASAVGSLSKVAVFIGATWGAVGLGCAHMRRHLGTTRFPWA